MDDRTDFSLPEGDGDGGTAAEARPTQPPVIVIEYRNRGLATRLMPPALILLAALAIASYQRKTPVVAYAPHPKVAAEPTTPATAVDSSPVAVALAESPTRAAAEPAKVEQAAPASPEPAAVPGGASVFEEQARQPSPFDLDPSDGLRPVTASTPAALSRDRPTSDDPTPGALPIEPTPGHETEPPGRPADAASRDVILRDIEREADQKDARRQDLEELKTNARSLLMNEALTRVQNSRAPFRNDLRQLLADLGNDAGQEIVRLCDRYGKDPLPEVKNTYKRLLRSAPPRMARPAKVEMWRAIGVPEPLILDQLCHEWDKMLNTRNGPRTEDEVRVHAARALLKIPLSPPRKPASKANETSKTSSASGAPSRPLSRVSARP